MDEEISEPASADVHPGERFHTGRLQLEGAVWHPGHHPPPQVPNWSRRDGVDGRRGAEIVISRGAIGDSASWAVLTERRGKRVRLKAPARAHGWNLYAGFHVVDGFAGNSRGGKIRLRYNHLRARGSVRFVGRAYVYRWRKGGWKRVGARKISARNQSSAWRQYGGWLIRGLR